MRLWHTWFWSSSNWVSVNPSTFQKPAANFFKLGFKPRLRKWFAMGRAAWCRTCQIPGIGSSCWWNLERAAARVCREAGARVTTYTRLADLNVQHVQHRWSAHRSHRKRLAPLGWGSIGSRHHSGLPTHPCRWTPPSGRPLCRSSTPRCPQSQRTDLPRTPSQFQMPPCRSRHRSGRPLERGNRCFHHQPRTSQNKRHTGTIAPRRYRLPHLQMDSFPHTRGTFSICSQPPLRGPSPPSQSRRRAPTALLAQLPSDPTDPSRLPPHHPWFVNGLCLWTLHIWRLASIKTVPMPGSCPARQLWETLSRKKGVRKKKPLSMPMCPTP